MFPRDLVTAPREWAERFYDVVRYTAFPRGGHFPAWEAPEAYGADLTAFARALPAAPPAAAPRP
jgi:microsomal epoxide hydrolase